MNELFIWDTACENCKHGGHIERGNVTCLLKGRCTDKGQWEYGERQKSEQELEQEELNNLRQHVYFGGRRNGKTNAIMIEMQNKINELTAKLNAVYQNPCNKYPGCGYCKECNNIPQLQKQVAKLNEKGKE